MCLPSARDGFALGVHQQITELPTAIIYQRTKDQQQLILTLTLSK